MLHQSWTGWKIPSHLFGRIIVFLYTRYPLFVFLMNVDKSLQIGASFSFSVVMDFVIFVFDYIWKHSFCVLISHFSVVWRSWIFLFNMFGKWASVEFTFHPVHVRAELFGLSRLILYLVVTRFGLIKGTSLSILIE